MQWFYVQAESSSLARGVVIKFLVSKFTEVLFLAEWWSGSDVRIFASDESFQRWGKEHALIIMNHTFEVDWLMGWIVADRSQTLGVKFQLSVKQFEDYYCCSLL